MFRVFYRLPALLGACLLLGSTNATLGSGFRGHLDALTVESKYVVIGTCTHRAEGLPSATLRVERVVKSPKSKPNPKELTVTGITSSATRFPFIKGNRYFVFVDDKGMATMQGSATLVEKDGTLVNRHELICIDEANSVEQLTAQVQSVLSGEYEKKLRKTMADPKTTPALRRRSGMALVRILGRRAAGPLSEMLYALSAVRINDGSCSDVVEALIRLDPRTAVDLWIKICRTQTLRDSLFYSLTGAIGDRGIKIDQLEERLPTLLKKHRRWKKEDPGETPDAYMLTILANQGYRGKESKSMLMSVLAEKKIVFVKRVFTAAVRLDFPESAPLIWTQLKTLEEQGYEYGNSIPHTRVDGAGAVLVYRGSPGKVPPARNALLKQFPELRGHLDDSPIRMGSGIYFLTSEDQRGNRSIYFVGRCYGDRGKQRSERTIVLRPFRLVGHWNKDPESPK